MEQVKEIKKKALDIIELCASSTTPEDIADDQGWTKAHTAKTWLDIYTGLGGIVYEQVVTCDRIADITVNKRKRK